MEPSEMREAGKKLVTLYSLDLDDTPGNDPVRWTSCRNSHPSDYDVYSNCSGESTFLKLKLIKDEHRSTISQSRLFHLTMLSTEWDIMCRINHYNMLSGLRCYQNAQIVQ